MQHVISALCDFYKGRERIHQQGLPSYEDQTKLSEYSVRIKSINVMNVIINSGTDQFWELELTGIHKQLNA